MALGVCKLGRISKNEKEQRLKQMSMNTEECKDRLYNVIYSFKLTLHNQNYSSFFFKDVEENAANEVIDSIEKFNFLDKESNLNYLTLHNLLNLSKIRCFKSLNTAQLVPRNYFTNTYLNTCNENILFILVTLRDKCYQLFVEARQYFAANLEYANRMRTEHNANLYGQHLSAQEFFDRVLKYMEKFAPECVKYAQKLPGFSRINNSDCFTIIKTRTFSYLHLISEHLIIDGENYILLSDDCQTSKFMITKVFGEKMCSMLFAFHDKLKRLALTEHELAVIIPVIITSPS